MALELCAIHESPGPEYRFAMLDREVALELWPEIEGLVGRALEYAFDGMQSAEILGRILTRQLYCLVVIDERNAIKGCATIEVYNAKVKTAHCVTFAGDDLEGWVDDWLEVWSTAARELGCSRISIKGRAGWERYAKRLGFEHTYTIMHKEV
jgi:hypothetical protein